MKKRLAFRKALFTRSFSRGYGLPIIVSVVLHLLILGFLTTNWSSDKERIIVQPSSVRASLVELEQPKPAAPPPPTVQPKPRVDDSAQKARQLAEQKRRQEEARKKAEQQRQKEIALRKEREAREKAHREEEARKERERQQKLAQEKARQQQEALRRQLELEQQRREQQQAAAAQAEKDASEVAYYSGLFKQLVGQNWNRPPSARNNMIVELQVELSPFGDLLAVRLLKGSGNEALDRSAIQAVRSAAPFPELQKLDRRIFDENFRRFSFVFSPQDLVR